MSLHQYLKTVNKLPTTNQTGLPLKVRKELNEAVGSMLELDKTSSGKGGVLTAVDHTAIGRCTTENGITAAVRMFKATHSVGQSPVN